MATFDLKNTDSGMMPSDEDYKSSYIWDLSEIFSSLLSTHEYSYDALIIAIQFWLWFGSDGII